MSSSGELARRLAIQISRRHVLSLSREGAWTAALDSLTPKPGTMTTPPYVFAQLLSRSKSSKPHFPPLTSPGTAPKTGHQTPSPVGSAPKPGVQTPPKTVASPLPAASAAKPAQTPQTPPKTIASPLPAASVAKPAQTPPTTSASTPTAAAEKAAVPPKASQKYFTGTPSKAPAVGGAPSGGTIPKVGSSGAAAAPRGGPPAGGPAPTSNRWLLSPAVPVDVRFVAAGIAAFGAFIVYAYTRKVEEFAQKDPLERDFGPAIIDKEVLEEVKSHKHGGDPATGDFYTDELALEGGKEGAEGHPGAEGTATPVASSNDDAEELDLSTPPSNTEEIEHVAQILSSISANQLEELWNQQEENHQEDHTPLRDAVLESTSSGDSPKPAEEPAADEQKGAEAAHEQEKQAAREKKVQETLEVVKRAVADSAGEGAVSSAASSNATWRKAEEAVVATTLAQAEEEDDAQPDSLGISEDLRPAALIRKAIERGEGAGDDWAEYNHRLAQAEADARTFSEARKQAEKFHEEEISKLKAAAAEQAHRAAQLERTLRDTAASFHQILDKQDLAAARQREAELKRQAEYLATAFAEASLKERATRIGALDQVRMKLNSLERAFQRRSQERVTSHGAHKVSLGTFALEAALEEGRPFAAEARALQRSCSDDPLVAATVASLPANVAEKGVPTRVQLQDQWPDVLRLSRQLAYLPKGGGGGMLPMALASLASRLKVKETPGDGPPQTVDQTLAHAESALVNGRLTDAALTLEQGLAGTTAEAAVRDWTEGVKNRAIAEQAVKVLQAHATAKAASLS